MGLSQDTRNYLVRIWYLEELGRAPSAKEQADQAAAIEKNGVDPTFASIYDSAEAKKHRRTTGRKA